MKKILGILSFIVRIFFIFILFYYALIMWQLTAITSVSKYGNVINLRWLRPDLIGHFPDRVPLDAQEKRFYYRAGFLQGGSSIELKIRMPEEFVREVRATYISQAKSVFNGAENLKRGSDGPDVPPKWNFFTFSSDRNETTVESQHLPQDFEILLLSPYPSNLNHGETSGIGISQKRGEIIYWAEDW